MNELEIMAKLKQVYESLIDIRDNSNIKISSDTINDLEKAYHKAYEKLSIKEPEKLLAFDNYYDNQYFISDTLFVDYFDSNNRPVTCGDINYYWCVDEKFN